MVFKVSCQFTGLIFDFDGLLVDTETPAYEAWQSIYEEYGASLALADWVQCVGSGYHRFDPVEHLAQLSGRRDLDGPDLIKRKNELKAARCDSQALQPGVLSLIEQAQARGLAVAVASSSGHAWVDHHLARTGLNRKIKVVVCREDVEQIKPAPDLFLAAAAGLGIAPERCVVFEDSPNGVVAAIAANCLPIAVPNPITSSATFPDGTIKVASLTDIELEESSSGA